MSEAKTDIKNWKKILKIVVNVVLWLFVAFAVIVTILAFAAQRSADGIPTVGGKCYLTVLSDSMSPTFKEGDLIVCKKLSNEGKASLKKDDIISFHTQLDINGDGKAEDVINTHRVVDVELNAEGKVARYITRGDNNVANDIESVHYTDVVAKYTGTRLRGFGNFLSFLQTPKGFLVVIILPLIAFFLYEVYVFIKTFLGIKNEGKKVISTADEELIKQKAVEEYLKQQAAEQAAKEAEAPPESDNQSKE